MEQLKKQLLIIDEDYLIQISNRGIVNRSLREISEIQIEINLENEVLQAYFSDDTNVVIRESLNNYQCSCPSRSICKHVIMALMKSKEVLGQVEEIEEVKISSFDYLLDFNAEKLIRQFGKTTFNDVLYTVMMGSSVEIEITTMLNLYFPQQGITLRFLPDSDLKQSTCTCKEVNCRHRLEAIMQYQKFCNGSLNYEMVVDENEISGHILPIVDELINEIFMIGLVRLSKEYALKCAQFAVMCHGAGFANFERILNRIEAELNFYLQKSANFNKMRLLLDLAQMVQMCHAFEGSDSINRQQLAGRFKKRYMELPQITVVGLGSQPWYSKSGYCGISASFYCPELERVLTYNVSRPTESLQQALKMLEQIKKTQMIWQISSTLESLSKCAICLTSSKISEDGRISTSEKTEGTLLQTVNLHDHEIRKWIVKDYHKIPDLFPTDLAEQFLTTAVILVTHMDNGYFDPVSQTYLATVYDPLNHALILRIPYSKVNEIAIKNFEFMFESKIIPEALTVTLGLSQETQSIVVFPIAAWLNQEVACIASTPLFSETKKSIYAHYFKEV